MKPLFIIRVLVLYMIAMNTLLFPSPGKGIRIVGHSKHSSLNWTNTEILVQGYPEIFAINTSGHILMKYNLTGRIVTNPAWSPNYQDIACIQRANDYGYSPSLGIWIVDRNGRHWRKLDSGNDRNPSWSPDSKRLAFVRREAGKKYLLCLIKVKSGQRITIWNDSHLIADPVWSPDGKRLLFTSSRSGYKQLWLISLSGGDLVLLPGQPAGPCMKPNWCWASDRIVFMLSQDDEDVFPAVLYTISPNGSRRKRLPIKNVMILNVVWSPDGQRLAFTRAVTTHSCALWISHANGSHLKWIYPDDPEGYHADTYLSW